MGLLGIFRTIETGVVVDKGHYDAQGGFTREVLTAFNKSRLVVYSQSIAIPERWTLFVDGTDKKGHKLHKEIDVSEQQWNNTQINDTYKRNDPQWANIILT